VSREERDLVIRRILVALDTSAHSRAALEAAAELAEQFRAELVGVFVEDVNLLRLTQLPFTREVGFYSARERQLRPHELERHLRAQAQRLRRLLRSVAQRAELTWSFDVTRGRTVDELLRAAEQVDLIILGRRGRTVVRRRHLGSTARAMVDSAPAMTLLLHEGACLGTPIMAVYDGSTVGQRAVAAAAALAASRNARLTVILADSREDVGRLRDQAQRQLADEDLAVRYVALTSSTASRLASVVQTEGCGLLVLPAKTALLRREELVTLVEEAELPLLLVR
jgi:nucleotide-binding universal stress UspA family protein